MLAGIYDSFQHWGEKHQTVWIYSDPYFNDNELADIIIAQQEKGERRKENAST